MQIVNASTSTPNILDSHLFHMTPKSTYRKGPSLGDVSANENMIQIENQSQSIKTPTIYKSEICILSPGPNLDKIEDHSFIQKINSLHQESYFHSPGQKQKKEEQVKLMNEFEEIPQQLEGFLNLIESQTSRSQLEVNQINCFDYFYRYLIVIIYFKYIITIICLPYATANNNCPIYYFLLLLKLTDVFIQIKLQFIEKNKLFLLDRQSLQTTQHEIVQIIGIFCLIFLTNTLVIKWLITIFVLSCSFQKIHVQEFTLRLEFNLKHEKFSPFLLIFRLSIFTHMLTCIWYSFNQHSEENGNNNDYWDSLFAVVSVISFNNQTKITEINQKICFTFVSFSGLFILAYIIHSTKEVLGSSKQDLSEFQQAFSRVSIQLKQQIIKYINEHANKRDKPILPSSMANKMAFHLGYHILKCCFPQYERSTLTKCFNFCEEIEVQTEEKILKEGQVDDCSIYFILQGNINIVDRQCQEIFGSKQAGQYFGEYAFYTQHPRSATVMSDGCCKLLKLKRIDFLSCLSWKDKQIFQIEHEQMMLSNKYNWECYCCHSYEHTINQCPKLTYKPQRQMILKQYIKDSVNKRLNIRRGRITRHESAWVNRRQIQVSENKIQYLQNDFFTPTSGLASNCQLPYEESQSGIQNSNLQFDNKMDTNERNETYERNDHSLQTSITAGFRYQFPSKLLTDSKMEIINEIKSVEAIDQQEFQKIQSIPQSQISSPDFVDMGQIEKQSIKQKIQDKIRSLKSISLKKKSTDPKSNLQSNFTPFSGIENLNVDDLDQVQNFQFYRPQSNLEQILQIQYFAHL